MEKPFLSLPLANPIQVNSQISSPRVHFLLSRVEIEVMNNFSCTPESGMVITLDRLEATLRFISHEHHQWQAHLNPETEAETYGSQQWSVEIRYTNPQFVDLPNEISYLFPAFNEPIFGVPHVLVCLTSVFGGTNQGGPVL